MVSLLSRMFEIEPVVWLQQWASAPLTAVMNGVSLLGYTRACVAMAVLLAFAFRVRAAVALLVLIAVSGAITDATKAAVAAPRPDWLHPSVQSLSLFAEGVRGRDADTPTEMEDDFGFPSGHVSATTAFAGGAAILLRFGRRGWAAAVAWIALMAVSRVYLGRHFPGDLLGGLLVGLITLLVGFRVLALGHLAREPRAPDPWPAHRLMAAAAACAATALSLGLPDAGDAGRLLGIAAGVLVLGNVDVFARAHARRHRVVLLVGAAAGFAAAWAVMNGFLEAADPGRTSPLRLIASALPNAALLIVPALVSRRFVAPGLAREAA